MAISQETVEEVLRTANVYDVISDYINLEKAGSNYKALCPFHQEKTPSFMVSPTKNIFKCFGCGKSGSAINFVMEYEGISFGEAVIKLAEKYNIPVKFTKPDKSIEEKKGLVSVAEKVKRFYKEQLKKSREAKEYIKKRELLPRTVDFFDIGFSPFDSSELVEFCKKEGITVEQLKKIGLVTVKEDGMIKDKFAGRLIFPIKDHRGRTVAFGGRTLIEDRQPKYINSPETEIYSKGKILYGFFESKDFLREKKEVIIVEGYIDLISLYQAGIKNVVATLGTAMTQHHGKLLSRFVKRAILMFDSDSAGKKAAIRASKILLPFKIDVYYCPLEKGTDPDDLAKKGYREVEAYLKKSKDFLFFLLDRIQEQKDLKKRKDIIDLYLEILSYIPDKHVQGLYIKELSEKTGIPVDMLQVMERAPVKNEEENRLSLDELYYREKMVLKGLLEYKDEILRMFTDFDKITGSPYFLYLLNEILKDGEVEELEHLKNANIPADPETVVYALNQMHKEWTHQQNEIEAALFPSIDDSLIKKIFQNKKSLHTGGKKKK
ncbi:DNA primase [Persephonella hydrogeniphila]|uniref:DNA primase n=1 Tax=Persephonella hydrogeniphila TaxID=198703 RepID=A0A285MY95_9AQUI|nr:DNA primase [Persephonella hydrogeniphila]SNZ02155.1 DNA primase [Persephonella hydrogeniphila]